MSEITLTIKYGKDFSDSWAVFRGETTEVLRDQVIDYFGLDRASVAELTLNELSVNVTSIAHGMRNVVKTLPGSRAIPAQQPSGGEAQTTPSDPWKAAQESMSTEAPTEPEGPSLLEQIEEVKTIDALKRMWADNQAAFAADPELLAAWKAKGKALSS